MEHKMMTIELFFSSSGLSTGVSNYLWDENISLTLKILVFVNGTGASWKAPGLVAFIASCFCITTERNLKIRM